MSNLIPKLSGLITHSYMKFEMFYTVLSLFLLVGVNNTNAVRKEKIKQEMNKIKSILNASYTAILDIQKNIAVLKDIPSLKIDVLLTNLEKKLEQNLFEKLLYTKSVANIPVQQEDHGREKNAKHLLPKLEFCLNTTSQMLGNIKNKLRTENMADEESWGFAKMELKLCIDVFDQLKSLQ